MQRLLARVIGEAEALAGGGEGPASLSALKAEADLVSLAARTAEKILELNKVIALEADASGTGALSAAERAALRERVEKWIDQRARALLAEWLSGKRTERDLAALARTPDRDEGEPASGDGAQ